MTKLQKLLCNSIDIPDAFILDILYLIEKITEKRKNEGLQGKKQVLRFGINQVNKWFTTVKFTKKQKSKQTKAKKKNNIFLFFYFVSNWRIYFMVIPKVSQIMN